MKLEIKQESELDKIIEEYNEIASSWNGSDDYFYSQGDQYHEEDAHLASDIVDAATHLKNLLDDVNF